jgi:hypothetical protein
LAPKYTYIYTAKPGARESTPTPPNREPATPAASTVRLSLAIARRPASQPTSLFSSCHPCLFNRILEAVAAPAQRRPDLASDDSLYGAVCCLLELGSSLYDNEERLQQAFLARIMAQ